MIIAEVYRLKISGHYAYSSPVVTSSEEEMTTKLEAISEKSQLLYPIPKRFGIGQLISLSNCAFAKIIYIGPLPEGGLVL